MTGTALLRKHYPTPLNTGPQFERWQGTVTFASDYDHETYNVDYNLRFIKKHADSTILDLLRNIQIVQS